MTEGSSRMGVGESHSAPRQLVEMGRGNPGLGVVAAYVAITHVIDQDEDDVGVPGTDHRRP